MKTISVSELKAHLSKYLSEVRRGGEIQVLDRGEPVARLVPLDRSAYQDGNEHRERLIRAGLLRAGSGDTRAVLETEPLDLGISLLAALEEEREDRL